MIRDEFKISDAFPSILSHIQAEAIFLYHKKWNQLFEKVNERPLTQKSIHNLLPSFFHLYTKYEQEGCDKISPLAM